MREGKPPNPLLEIWIDGECSVCRKSERWCAARDRKQRLSFQDLHVRACGAPPAPFATMMETVHVRLPDGTIRTGFDAWREIIFQLDGWRWLARVAALPGFKHLGAAVYSVLARNRHRLPVDGA